MKTLYFTKRTGMSYYNNPILVDVINNKFEAKESTCSNLNQMFVADEPVEIRYEFKGKTYVKKADKGDIILSFYSRVDYDMTPIIVVKNNDWKTNIVNAMAALEANRAKDTVIASYDLQSKDCGCCNSCESCSC